MNQQRAPSVVIREKLEGMLSEAAMDSVARHDLYTKVRRLFSQKYPEHLSILEDVIRDIEKQYVRSRGKSRMGNAVVLAIAAVIALSALGGAAAWWITGSPGPDMVAADRLQDYSASGDPLQPLSVEHRRYAEVLLDDDVAIEAVGYGPLFAIAPIEVDPDATYIVSARIRVTRDDPEVGGARTYVGVATYDATDQLQTTPPPGAHRYAAATNRVISAADGWVEVQGEMTGFGDDTHNQFRPGTTFVRPMVLLNYKSAGATSQVMSLKMIRK